MRSVSREEMREIDKKAIEEIGIPGVVLMENAGRSVANVIANMRPAEKSRVAIFCGSGNNGGDGFVCARHLYNKGFNISVALLGKIADVKGDAEINLKIISHMGIAILEINEFSKLPWQEVISNADIIVDAIFGTGLKKEVKGIYADVIKRINDSKKLIVAVDIPSGLDANSGLPLGVAVRSTKTVTMGLRKIAFDNSSAAEFTGEVIVADIGIPRDLLCT